MEEKNIEIREIKYEQSSQINILSEFSRRIESELELDPESSLPNLLTEIIYRIGELERKNFDEASKKRLNKYIGKLFSLFFKYSEFLHPENFELLKQGIIDVFNKIGPKLVNEYRGNKYKNEK